LDKNGWFRDITLEPTSAVRIRNKNEEGEKRKKREGKTILASARRISPLLRLQTWGRVKILYRLLFKHFGWEKGKKKKKKKEGGTGTR